jgi:pimeloyl-ACP methyl ester carboxylesterase
MPRVNANRITINYDQQGAGDALILIPYLAADYACYAFQVAEYAKHFTCFSLDLRGTGGTDSPAGTYSTELFADDVAAFMQAVGIQKAHVSGLSLGAATGLWLAASTRIESNPYQSIVVGRRPICSSRPSSKAGR